MSETLKRAHSSNIYLIGFMGAGKSTVGRLLAPLLGREFLDLDEHIIAEAQSPISEIFAREGERGFRQRESAALHQIAQRQNLLIALGGGAVLDDENWELIRQTGVSIYLKVCPELLAQRVAGEPARPLLIGSTPEQRLQEITELLQRRTERYEQADLIIENNGAPAEAVAMICRHLEDLTPNPLPKGKGCRGEAYFAPAQGEGRGGRSGDGVRQGEGPRAPHVVHVELQERSCFIWVKPGLLKNLGELYRGYRLGSRAAILTDTTVAKLYGERVVHSLRRHGVEPLMVSLPPGEEQKSVRTVEQIYTRLIEAGCDRHATIIALGGGVIGDIAGFVASTFLRGVECVQIPTTLLAHVDSSVGGKTGINHPLGKNLIGTFYQPRCVLVDPTVLKTLPEREIWSGLAEVIKYGLIRDPALCQILEAHLEDFAGNPEGLADVIARCCAIKAEIVSSDERDGGLRKILNFGHTVGHAVEAASGYQLRHGEGIAWGMLAAARLSHIKTALSSGELERIERLLTRLPKPSLDGVSTEAILEFVRRDKKSRDGRVQFVLLRAIGEPVLCDTVTESELLQTLQTL